jgi:hypothetical protein
VAHGRHELALEALELRELVALALEPRHSLPGRIEGVVHQHQHEHAATDGHAFAG